MIARWFVGLKRVKCFEPSFKRSPGRGLGGQEGERIMLLWIWSIWVVIAIILALVNI